MNNAVNEYYKGIKNKKVFFLGAGLSHQQLIPKFIDCGASVTLCDIRNEDALKDYLNSLGKNIELNLNLGSSYLDYILSADIIFRTPGIDYTKPQIVEAVNSGITVTSEIEMFFEFCPCPTIGITGSDGKTTTSSLVAAILEKTGYRIWLGGNIGRPLFPVVEQIHKDDIAVIELSSFQLISMRRSPFISVITNITPNHLDHHKDMKEYIDAKRNILLYQNSNSKAVLNKENEITKGLSKDVKGELLFFGRTPVENGAYIDNNTLLSVENGRTSRVMELTGLNLLGEHNKENIAAAYAAVRSLVNDSVFTDVAKNFTGVEHRIEFIRELNGVKWYNDSIATSPTRTIAGLCSFENKIVLIAGGSDKGLSYQPLGEYLSKYVKCMYLSGPTATAIAAAVDEYEESPDIIFTENLKDSVSRAFIYAKPGDVVMLSPASPSFDFYSNFEERGRHFKQLVNSL